MSKVDALNLQAGDVVGGYTLVAPLGGGAMGSVWRARDDGGQDYAIKILRDSLADDQENGPASERERAEQISARERLRREALALRRINHPGVCQIVDMELDDSLAFIVTELIEGLNLRDDVAKNGRYTGDDLERLAQKLVDAVQAVHAAGIVHRDIKPTNVMISASGPILVDFGIAMGEGESHVTRTGLVMGTPGFIAPEIIDGDESDERSDWWSTAAVLAYAACGKPVFGAKPMMAVLERAASGSADLRGLPPRTMAAFRAALSPKCQDRPDPQNLLDAIATDALDASAWQAADEEDGDDSGALGDAASVESEASTEVVRPFGISSSADSGSDQPTQAFASREAYRSNPRLAWNQAPTQVVEQDERQGGAHTSVMPTHTRVMPTNTDYESTASDYGDKQDYEGAEGQTRALPDSWGQPSTQTQPLETARNLRVPLAGSDQSLSPDDTMPAAVPLEAQPGMAVYTPPPQAFMRRQAYLSRGKVVLTFIGLVLAALASFLPLASLLIAGVVLWALCASGLSRGGQIARELKRGGGRKTSDTALSLAAIPWQIGKSFVMALPRLVAMLLICALAMPLGGWALGLPLATGSITLAGLTLRLPLLAGSAWSISGLLAAACMLFSWLLAICSGRKPQDTYTASAPSIQDWRLAVLLGAGGLAGWVPQEEEGSESGVSQHNRRRLLVLGAVWLLLFALIAVFIVRQTPMDWSPLPIARPLP
ncbi:protein kinase [Bombiscardovia apis]|uniref:non-specific serine/threonine protein kinase n=1 Tax=Bombiscardovia apis TaxID=2932182 RepID=A0ABM8BEU4_9BIFI|nr:serine/threonine-protein kinase [Bombiscardovia apis]BDR55419.1 protein kinase [Bombiscardovia apis]